MQKEEFITCPYNNSHKVNRKDIHNHFYFRCKAAKNAKEKFQSCKFDNGVFFLKKNEAAHRENCVLCKESFRRLNDMSEVEGLRRKKKEEEEFLEKGEKLVDVEISILEGSQHNESMYEISKDI